MTIHLTWMTIVWVLAAIGAGVVAYLIIGALIVLFLFR